jgi:quercetin dioxygenase-like cupin family protein
MTEASRGEVLILREGHGPSWWQPVPANGHVEVKAAPGMVPMQQPFSVGTQTVAAGCYIREHAHDRNEEVIHVLKGSGTAVIDGEEHPMLPGTTFFLGRNRWHKFVNDGPEDMTFFWVMVPAGLEDFFAAIGRPRGPGEPAPEPFARPEDVLGIERRTVFAPPRPSDR